MIALLAQVPTPAAAPASGGSAEFWVFWIVAPVALGAAIAMVLARNAVHAALLLVINFLMIAVLYAVLEAQFLAAVQIIVYTGAIMVLFLFVIMLLGVDRALPTGEPLRFQRPVALLLGVLLFAALVTGVAGPFLGAGSACNVAPPEGATGPRCVGLVDVNAQEGGNVRGVGGLLFTRYMWPFEVTSALLVIAAIGAMVLGRKREDRADLVDVEREPEAAVAVAALEPERTDVGGESVAQTTEHGEGEGG